GPPGTCCLPQVSRRLAGRHGCPPPYQEASPGCPPRGGPSGFASGLFSGGILLDGAGAGTREVVAHPLTSADSTRAPVHTAIGRDLPWRTRGIQTIRPYVHQHCLTEVEDPGKLGPGRVDVGLNDFPACRPMLSRFAGNRPGLAWHHWCFHGHEFMGGLPSPRRG